MRPEQSNPDSGDLPPYWYLRPLYLEAKSTMRLRSVSSNLMAEVRLEAVDAVELVDAVVLVDVFGEDTLGRAATVRLLLLTGLLTLDLDLALRLEV